MNEHKLFINGHLISPDLSIEERLQFFADPARKAVNNDERYLAALLHLLDTEPFTSKPVTIITDADVRDHIWICKKEEYRKDPNTLYYPVTEEEGITFPDSWVRMWQKDTGKMRVRMRKSAATRAGLLPTGQLTCDLLIRLEYARYLFDGIIRSRTTYDIPDFFTYTVTREDGAEVTEEDMEKLRKAADETPETMLPGYRVTYTHMTEGELSECLLMEYKTLGNIATLPGRKYETDLIAHKIFHPALKGEELKAFWHLLYCNIVISFLDLKN